MAQHTNWDKWMSENLRYAMENNKNGKKLIYTYSEYYINHYKNNGYIDIVGKERYDSELNEDVIIEIKGSLSDLNSDMDNILSVILTFLLPIENF